MKRKIIRISLSLAVFITGFIFRSIQPLYISTVLFAAAYLIVGFGVLLSAGRNIIRGRFFDENFLMALASLGAFVISEYEEAAAVMIFYCIGELFESYAVARSRRSIASLVSIRPDRAFVLRNNETCEVAPEEIEPGELIVVRPGERIPLDGIVETGESAIDTAALTGESMPREIRPGNEALSGCINLSAVLYIRTTCSFHDCAVSRILQMVEDASSRKSRSENFITRFAAVYTPSVVGAALLLAVIPSIIDGQWLTWIYRALNFLVVSCPCALVISIPLSFFGGIGGASRAGVLVKGSSFLESLAAADTVVFDKTGTLTEGEFKLDRIEPVSMSKEELLELAAYAQYHSDHPVSRSIKAAYTQTIDESRITDAREHPGRGVDILLDGESVYAGNSTLMQSIGINVDSDSDASIVYIAKNAVYCGCLEIRDRIKQDAYNAVKSLRNTGIKKLYMLSGDRPEAAEKVGKELSLDDVYASLLPLDKVNILENLMNEASSHGKLIFVGDGINDAPVLARADVGVAMGALGSDAAIESADVVIMNDQPSRLCTAIRIAKRCMRIVRENIMFALSIKFTVLILCAFGILGMWYAVFADVGVMVLAVINALRCLKN